MKKPHAYGNSLAEYILPTCMIILVAGMLTSSSNLASAVPNWMNKTIKGTAQGSTVKVTELGYITPAQRPGSLKLAKDTKSLFKQLDSLTTLEEVMEFSDSIDTAGGLGGEDGGITLKSRILQKIAQLLAEEGADSALVDLIGRLSRDGYGIGGAISDLRESCGEGGCYTSIQPGDRIDPRDQAGYELYQTLSKCGSVSSTGCTQRLERGLTESVEGYEGLKQFEDTRKALDELLRQRPELASNPLVQQAKRLIDENAREIAETTTGLDLQTRTAGRDILRYEIIVKGVETDKPPEEIVDEDAKDICDQGGRGCRRG